PATMPPPCSTAVPVIVTRLPLATDPPLGGETTVDTGAKRSVYSVAAPSGGLCGSGPACSVAGCAPMSASTLTVACCIAWSVLCDFGVPPRSWTPSRPHDHCTVPAPKTIAPLLWRYRVIAWVARPPATLAPKSLNFSATSSVVDDRRIRPAGRE